MPVLGDETGGLGEGAVLVLHEYIRLLAFVLDYPHRFGTADALQDEEAGQGIYDCRHRRALSGGYIMPITPNGTATRCRCKPFSSVLSLRTFPSGGGRVLTCLIGIVPAPLLPQRIYLLV